VKTDTQCLDTAAAWAFESARNPDGAVSDMGIEEKAAAARALFWRRLEPCKTKLYGFVQKSLNFATDADDVYQETVLHAFQYAGSYREGGVFEAWLFGIAHNEIRKHFKKAMKAAPAFELEHLSSADTSSERGLIGEVYRFAERLGPRQREVFFLFYEAGFTTPEIAGITGLREGNVKFILNRARAELKKVLGESHA